VALDGLSGAHVVVTGGAGFLGSHLCERLLDDGARVTAIDNLVTGHVENVEHLIGSDGFRLVKYDVTDYLHVPGPADAILHFASPASPADYLKLPIQTLKVGALGIHKALGMARATWATFLLASTSEAYGDPQVHPQPETSWGARQPDRAAVDAPRRRVPDPLAVPRRRPRRGGRAAAGVRLRRPGQPRHRRRGDRPRPSRAVSSAGPHRWACATASSAPSPGSAPSSPDRLRVCWVQ
jgi:hypothetical protein